MAATKLKDSKKPTTIAEIRAAVQEARGKDSITTLTGQKIAPVPVIPTGLLSLDIALGIGGLPKGRLVEIAGEEGVGKSTLALHVVSEAQRLGGVCAYIDTENALDPAYARALGVDTEALLFSQPGTGEDALNLVDSLVDTGGVSVIVVDSVAALVPKAELEGDIGDSHMGLQARMMGQAMRILVGKVQRAGAILIFINQYRAKIGVMFGSNKTTTGGNALRFFSSIRLELGRRGMLKEGEKPIGSLINVKVLKNKHAPPFKETEIDVVWGLGFDKISDLFGLAVGQGLIAKDGASFTYKSEKFAHGLNKAIGRLKEDTKLQAEIRKAVLAGLVKP